ncbi:hypothetical protein EK21DRAFT_92092 [Setomelanomma holmii]|uniref:Uncharacterized protein n=1 Tax=Setomelanomma holmii TaxID=210430 RepID=A0A9P4H2Q2_9PLEO|nr:hypothetical protein EK21DRAFT_92092 [Setomelanomma holmii]
MANSTSSEIAQDGNTFKESHPQSKGLRTRLKRTLRSNGQEQPDQSTHNPGQITPLPVQNAQRKPSMPATQHPSSSKKHTPGDEDSIANLNKVAKDIERQWSMDETKDKHEIQPSLGSARVEHLSGTPNVSRKAINGRPMPATVAPLQDPNHHGPTLLSSTNGILTSARAPHLVHVAEPQSIEGAPANLPHTNGYPQQSFKNEQHSARRPSNGLRSQSYELLHREHDILKKQHELLQERLHAFQDAEHQARSLDEENQSIRLAHDRTLEDLGRLETERDDYASVAAQLAQENAKLQEDVLAWRTQFNLANSDLLLLRSDLTSAKKVDDQWFAAQWREIHEKIKLLSHQYFQGHLPRPGNSILERFKGVRPEEMATHPDKALTRLSDSHGRYLRSDHDRPLIVQGFIWCALVLNVFDHLGIHDGGFYWAGQSRAILYHMNREVKPVRPRRQKDSLPAPPSEIQRIANETRNYHKWRAETGIMMLAQESISKRTRNINNELTSLVAEIFDALAPYIVPRKDRPVNAVGLDIKDQLRAILIQAIETDAEMAQQRASVYCEQWFGSFEGNPQWGFPYQPEDADIVATPDQAKGGQLQLKNPCVDLIIQPALFREGNQYGEDYSTRHILCRAKVVVGEDPTLPACRRW